MNAIRSVKWLALVCMTLDHIDAACFGRQMGPLSEIGRLTMPLFAAVLAYNLARPGALERGMHERVTTRLVFFGTLAYPFHVWALGQGWATANIMFAFAIGVGAVWLIQRRGAIDLWPVVLVLAGGVLVEFHWAGPMLVVGFWGMFERMPVLGTVGPLAGMALLCVENGNLWALAALPLVLLMTNPGQDGPRPRWEGWAFYAYYPAHLALLVALVPLVRAVG